MVRASWPTSWKGSRPRGGDRIFDGLNLSVPVELVLRPQPTKMRIEICADFQVSFPSLLFLPVGPVLGLPRLADSLNRDMGLAMPGMALRIPRFPILRPLNGRMLPGTVKSPFLRGKL